MSRSDKRSRKILILRVWGGRCCYCRRPLTLEETTMDHRWPRSKGGRDSIDNLIPACYRCNQAKGRMTIREFVKMRERKAMRKRARKFMVAKCYDCSRPYGDEHGFPDLIISNDVWKRIAPDGDGNGLLCPSCICGRLYNAGISEVEGAFMSGPVKSLDRSLMTAILTTQRLDARAVEIIEQARGGK